MGASQILWWPSIDEVFLLIVTFVLILVVIFSKKSTYPKNLAFFLTGFVYTLLVCQTQLQSQLTTQQLLNFAGHIDSLPKKSDQKISFLSRNPNTNQTYLLNWYITKERKIIDFIPGEKYQFEVSLKPPHGTVNELGFDREKWLFRNRIDGIGTIKSAQPMNSMSLSPKHIVDRWRKGLAEKIENNFSAKQVSALIQALSIGDKSLFEHEDFQRFQKTGTAHLIAISGLHIGMVALIGYLIGTAVFWLWPQQRISKPVWQVMIGLCLALLYAALAGFAVSTQRAVIMLLVYAFFKLTHRQSFAWDVWSFSLMLVLLIDPLNVLDAGFWLSFMAVAILILCFQGIKRSKHKLGQFITMQWRLLLGLLPLSLLVFSHINLLTPLVNMIMIPLMTFVIVPLMMLLLINFTLFNSMANWLVTLLELCSQWFLNCLDWLSIHAVLPVNFSIEHGWQMLILVLGVFILILPKAVPQRFWGIALIVLATWPIKTATPEGHFRVRFFDVGQGLAVHIETSNHHLIYDVGAAYESGFNMADSILLPYLKRKNIDLIDTLILSHQDNDHSGAATYLQQSIEINQIYGTEQQHQPCITGLNWQWDQVKFSVLSPYNLSPYLKNNSSCVLKVTSKDGYSLLLTGDIESPVEYRLSHMNHKDITADVLLIPHHGSKTSSTEAFIQAVNPMIAINSSGQYNPFNHPAPSVMATYEKLAIPVFDTQDYGMIELTSLPGDTIQLMRQTEQKLWRKKNPE